LYFSIHLGGFSYVYLVRELSDTAAGGSLNSTVHGDGSALPKSGSTRNIGRTGSGSGSNTTGPIPPSSNTDASAAATRQGSLGKEGTDQCKDMVLKVTSIVSRQQRDIAEKEAKLLSRLSHPSVIKMFDTCYRTTTSSLSASSNTNDRKNHQKDDGKHKERPQHLILLEYCEGGHALDVCNRLVAAGERFDLSTLIIAFGQICNAVSYLHAQRPPIVHRDLKPANFLVKNGAYKLADFGSAVFGYVELKTPEQRREATEVIEKTTTQMFRAPEMVDLYMARKLTQATDVWALGACLFSLAFLQNCFEEGSNLAILNCAYKVPDDNPYGDGLVELLDRMLTVDHKDRADMTEVILCLSAVYSGRPLPPRKEREKKEKSSSSSSSKKEKDGKESKPKKPLSGEDQPVDTREKKKPEAKKLPANSAAKRRLMAAGGDKELESLHSRFDDSMNQPVDENLAFSTTDNPFSASGNNSRTFPDHMMSSNDMDVMNTFDSSANWADSADAVDEDEALSSFLPGENGENGGKNDRRRDTRSTARSARPGRPGASIRSKSRDRRKRTSSADLRKRSGSATLDPNEVNKLSHDLGDLDVDDDDDEDDDNHDSNDHQQRAETTSQGRRLERQSSSGSMPSTQRSSTAPVSRSLSRPRRTASHQVASTSRR
jgi:serine/threonine protein kinase